jgi:chromosome segregation ATPase
MNLINLNQTESHFILSIPNVLNNRAKNIDSSEWDSINHVWKFPRNLVSYDSLKNEFKKEIKNFKISRPLPSKNNSNLETTIDKKNKTINDQRKRIEFLESQIKEKDSEIEIREHELERYISSIVELNEEITQLSSADHKLENTIKKIASQCAKDNEKFLRIINDIEFDLTLPIEISKKVINLLRTITKNKDQRVDFADLIGQARRQKFLSKEAIGLLHIIRNQRNIFAHSSLNPNTRMMRVILIISAFSLLADEINQGAR